MVEAHKARAHSRVGPSAMHRIVECPGSVLAGQYESDKGSSFFALEGTAAHELCEFVMSTGADPLDYLGGLVDLGPEKAENEDPEDGNPVPPFLAINKRSSSNPQPDSVRYWRIDEEMVEGAILYRDTINLYIEPGDIVEFETRLDISHIHPDCFGTSDALVIKPDAKRYFDIDLRAWLTDKTGTHIVVGDYKYGSGLLVEVDDNEQVWTYGAGARKRFHNYGIEWVTFVIVQPRAFHREGPVRAQTIHVDELIAFEKQLAGILAEASSPGARFKAGAHCRFCPIAHKCNVLRKHCLTSIGAKFRMGQEIYDGDMPVIERMSKADLGRVYRETQIIEAWIRRFLEYAHKEAVNGNVPEGLKVVSKRQYRKFRNPEDVLVTLDILGYDEDETMTPSELRTPFQIEKIIGKKEFKKYLEKDVAKSSPGVVLALLEDQRPAVKLDHSDVFGAAEDDDE